ncbi:hypothetical protein L3081_17765 [Colwellia sp. MSW7]|uniref:Uncharacterized protein n=1 Tax=Colwellia maritima TaxID=2912588 RepID=A0ABS9X3U4_9GAMM|nr:hypothetical protein [Colwellia maritima]MCI2284899.1 hypothetical protein [Colwellia maritima]
MKTLPLGSSNISSSRLIYGCMRILGDNSAQDRAKGKRAIQTALEVVTTILIMLTFMVAVRVKAYLVNY